MKKKVIETSHAPKPIGPYSQAVRAGKFLFVSGQIAIDPVTGQLALDNLEQETRQVMANIAAILDEAGMGFGNIVKTSIFLKNMNDFAKVNELYGAYFDGEYPARETVQVARLPRDVNVEISVIAVKL